MQISVLIDIRMIKKHHHKIKKYNGNECKIIPTWDPCKVGPSDLEANVSLNQLHI